MATQYIVLRKFDDVPYADPADGNVGNVAENLWQIVAEDVEAGSAESACRITAKAQQVEGRYRAVPVSSFREVPIVRESEPRFIVRGQERLEEAFEA